MVKNYTISVLNSKLAEASIDFWLSNPQKIDNVIDFINELNKEPVKLSAAEQARKDARENEFIRIKLLISKAVADGDGSLRIADPLWSATIERLKAEGFKLAMEVVPGFGTRYTISWI